MSGLPLVDVHAHLQDESYSAGELDAIIADIQSSSMYAVVNCGSDLVSSQKAVELSDRHSKLWAMAGFHPHDAKKWTDDSLSQIAKMIEHPKVLGIGEIGLDYHYDFSPRDEQIDVFSKQWIFAAEKQLPVEVHVRKAYEDFWKVTKNLPENPKVILHCFSGGIEEARKAVELGYSISIGGVITFPKSNSVREIIQTIPIERIHLETDCPYLAPVPLRGKKNDPTKLRYAFETLCSLKEMNEAELAEQLKKNAENFFGKKFS
ncbi:MAG: TatD family hydrolase [Candidatus Riflebacteria bacterium]|nr:TatD family hydrolase [Candidatus Riflebacteria bacterium]